MEQLDYYILKVFLVVFIADLLVWKQLYSEENVLRNDSFF